MSYLTIGSTSYLVRVGNGKGRVHQIENRRRAIDGGLLVDSIATKRELQIEITGTAVSGRFFTPAEASALITALKAGALSISGTAGSFTARARDIGWVDGQDWSGGAPMAYRWVSATLEEV